MTKAQWRKREERWRRFAAWEAEHAEIKLSPSQRLAEIGALVDRAMRGRRLSKQVSQGLAEKIKGISLMRKGLKVLSRAA